MVLRRRALAPTSRAAVALVTVLTLVFTGQAVVRLLTRSDPQTAREAALGVAATNAATGRTLTAVIVLAFCAVTGLMAIGLARRRQGSRHAGIVVFLLLGTVSLGSSFAGFTAEPPAPNAWLGGLNGVACLAVCALLVHRATAHDFELAEMERSRADLARTR